MGHNETKIIGKLIDIKYNMERKDVMAVNHDCAILKSYISQYPVDEYATLEMNRLVKMVLSDKQYSPNNEHVRMVDGLIRILRL